MLKVKSCLRDLYRTPYPRLRKEFLRLDMNEGVPGLPEDFVREALAAISGASLAMYPEYDSLVGKIALHNGLRPENIFLSNGSDAAIKYIFDAYVSPGDHVLMTDPTFAMYPVFCQIHSADVQYVRYRDDFSFPFGEYLEKLSSAPRVAVLVNPNNPTGHALARDELIAAIRIAEKRDVLLLVDEAYFYFYPHSIIEEVNKRHNLVVLRTFSKLCCLAAARLGYAASSLDIIKALQKVKLGYDVNGIAVRLAEELLDRPELIRQMTERTNEGKQYLINRLTEAGMQYRAGEANFVLIRCEGHIKEIAERLAEKRILVGSGFRQEFLKDYIRVTTGSIPAMETFWNAFVKIVPKRLV